MERQDLPDLGEEDGLSIVFRDVLLLLALCYMVVGLILLPLLGSAEERADNKARTVGALSVELTWRTPSGEDSLTDLDLWVKSPTDSSPVGYSNKIGKNFSLLRDDVGAGSTGGYVRFEFASALEAVPGEYIVNLFNYRFRDPHDRVVYQLRVVKPSQSGTVVLFEGSGEVAREDGETTVVRFVLDAQGNLVPGSIDRVYRRLVR